MRILILLALLASQAHADTYLTLGGWSVHTSKQYTHHFSPTEREKRDYNSSHNAVILEHNGYSAGYMRNSFDKDTFLAGYNYRYGDFSLTTAVATGYQELHTCIDIKNDLCLVFVGSYSMPYTKLSLIGNALAISFEFKLF